MKHEKQQWGTRFGFIMATVGSAIGLGNIWRFPYQVYDNGGGAFLVPYFFALLTAGIPILILEFTLGHKFRGGAPTTFARLSQKHKEIKSWEWLGWLQVGIAFAISIYYIIIIAWTLKYSVLAFGQKWGDDTAGFFFNDFLKLSDSPLHLGGINTGMLIPFFIAWLIVWGVLYSGVRKGIEAVNKVFMPTLIVLMLVLLFRSVTLEGATTGLDYLFKPDFSALKDVSVWAAAYGQIFFSLSICFAIMYSYSSYLPKKSDIINNAFITGFLNCGFSMLAGIAIFSILGNMAFVEGKEISEVAGAGLGLAFVTIPNAIGHFPFAQGFFGFLFFLSLTIAGLSSQISILEAVISGIHGKFPMPRKKLVSLVCGVAFALSFVMTTNAGLYLLDIIDYITNQFGILFAGLLELIFFGWFLKSKFVLDHANPLSDFKVGKSWTICVSIITPLILGYSAITNLGNEFDVNASRVLAKVNSLEVLQQAGITLSKEQILTTYEGYSTTAVNLGFGLLVLIFLAAFLLQHAKTKHDYLKMEEISDEGGF